MLNAEQMRLLPECFKRVPDPRRAQGRRHPLSVVLGIAAGATLCGMRGYKAIADWANALGQAARERFGCRRENGGYIVPSESIIRDCLLRVEPGTLDRAAQLMQSGLGTTRSSAGKATWVEPLGVWQWSGRERRCPSRRCGVAPRRE